MGEGEELDCCCDEWIGWHRLRSYSAGQGIRRCKGMACGLSPIAYRLSPIAYRLWACGPVGLWPVTCRLSPIAYRLWPVACGLWPVACDLWPVTRGLWPTYGWPRHMALQRSTTSGSKCFLQSIHCRVNPTPLVHSKGDTISIRMCIIHICMHMSTFMSIHVHTHFNAHVCTHVNGRCTRPYTCLCAEVITIADMWYHSKPIAVTIRYASMSSWTIQDL